MKLMNICAVIALAGLFTMANANTATMVVTVPNGEVTIEADCVPGGLLKVKRQVAGDVRSMNLGCGSRGSIG